MSKPRCREEVKSDEEWSAVLWLQEAVRHHLVLEWEYEPASFALFPPATYQEVKHLKTKDKIVDRCLCQGASYTPDFVITFTQKGKRLLLDTFKKSFMATGSEEYRIWIDVKGAFNPNDQPRYFSVIQKAMYYINGLWVSRIVPFHKQGRKAKGLFAETFAPESCRYMKRGPLNACGRACVGVEQFLELKCSK